MLAVYNEKLFSTKAACKHSHIIYILHISPESLIFLTNLLNKMQTSYKISNAKFVSFFCEKQIIITTIVIIIKNYYLKINNIGIIIFTIKTSKPGSQHSPLKVI